MQWMFNALEKCASRTGLVILGVSFALIFGLIWMLIIKLMALTGGIGILDFEIGIPRKKSGRYWAAMVLKAWHCTVTFSGSTSLTQCFMAC